MAPPFSLTICSSSVLVFFSGFSESLMLEVREHGVKVSVVMPGSVATDMVVGDSHDKSWMLKPEDVAAVVAQILAMPSHALTYQVEVRAANPKKG